MIYFTFKDTHRLNIKEWKEIFHADGNQKTVVWLYFYQRKYALSKRLSKKTSYYIMIKESSHQKVTKIVIEMHPKSKLLNI